MTSATPVASGGLSNGCMVTRIWSRMIEAGSRSTQGTSTRTPRQVLWRGNKTWRGVRVEVPWVEREAASIIRDHIRVTMQPFDGPPDHAGIADVSRPIG